MVSVEIVADSGIELSWISHDLSQAARHDRPMATGPVGFEPMVRVGVKVTDG